MSFYSLLYKYWTLFVIRVAGAIFSPILDCDEIYNYWEPIHYLQYGYGFQTWEYSPQYALRSWLYVYLHYYVLSTLQFFGLEKVNQFYMMRIILALFYSIAEVKVLERIEGKFGVQIGLYAYIFLLMSAGLFFSAHSLLPSTTSMVFTLFSLYYVLKIDIHDQKGLHNLIHLSRPILCCSIAIVLAWPFCAVIHAVFFLCILWKIKALLSIENIAIFIMSGILCLSVTIIPSIIVDYYLYGQIKVGFLNLVLYNTSFNKDNLGGDSVLFGVEPWYFYFLNLWLNFNVVSILFLSYPIILTVTKLIKPSIQNYYLANCIYISAVAWLGLMSKLPHKEERFLQPIYPFICISAACSVDLLFQVCQGWQISKSQLMNKIGWTLQILAQMIILIISPLINFSRVLMIVICYTAPMYIWNDIFQQIQYQNQHHYLNGLLQSNSICLGKEWYRFPSNYFTNSQSVYFYEDGFLGLLPVYFKNTTYINPILNNKNKNDPQLYINSSSCDYFVDLQRDKQTDQFITFKTYKFLETDLNPKFYRSYYIPWFNYNWSTYVFYPNVKKLASGKFNQNVFEAQQSVLGKK